MATFKNNICAEKKEGEAVDIRSVQEHHTDIAKKKWNWEQKCQNPETVDSRGSLWRIFKIPH